MNDNSSEAVREIVKERYGEAATAVARGLEVSCCGSSAACAAGAKDPITRDLYEAIQTEGIPEAALRASFGCGNPTALVELRLGDVVLDLGSGGGIDVLLAARRVGPTGRAYGLDMTPAMLDLARASQAEAGATNVEFLEGSIEAVPLPDNSIDVVISNCVINLSADKRRVLEEAFRVLRSGGRFAVSDVVLRHELPPLVQDSMELWTGCIAGALLESDYIAALEAAGFVDVSVEPTRIYSREDAAELARTAVGEGLGLSRDEVTAALDGAVMSACIRAKKP